MNENQSQENERATPEAAQAAGRRGAARPRRRVGLTALIVLAVLVLVVAAGGFALVGRPLVAPGWARERIEAQINAQLAGVQVGVGEVALVVETGWQPRVHLRDVTVRDAEGRHVLALSDVEATFAPRPLLSGEVRPERLWLTGMQVQLRRDEGGQVGLSFGEGAGASRQAASFAALAEQFDTALELPLLSEFETLAADGLTLRYEDARAGRAWTVDGGRVEIGQQGGELTIRGDFALLGGRDYASTLEVTYRGRLDTPEASFGMIFQDLAASDIAEQSAALLWLNVLRAPISGALRASTDSEGNLGPLSATLQIGEGVLQPTDATRPIPFRQARTYFTYEPQTQIMQVDELSVDTAWGTSRADGQVIVGELVDGWPRDFIAQMRLSEISFNPDEMYDAPVTLTDATADMRLRLDPFHLSLGQMTVRDGARQLVLSGDLRAPEEGWALSLQGRLDRLGPERLLELWPGRIVPRTREWVAENIITGEMNNIQVGLKADPGARPDLYLGFEFEGLETLFMKTMPPIRGGRGHATLIGDVFTVSADAGQVRAEKGGDVDIAGTSFQIPDVREKQGLGVVDLRSRSTITAALSLLDREPFEFLSKAGQPVTMADGIAETRGRIAFARKPKVPVEEVDYRIAAKLHNVRSETLVPGHVLAASGLDVSVTKGRLEVGGRGRISQVPIEGTFRAPLGQGGQGESTVEGWIELSQAFVDQFRVGLPAGTVSGAARGDVTIALKRGTPPVFTLSSGLEGLGLRIPQIDWAMGQGSAGRLVVSGRLGTPVAIEAIALDAPGLNATGRLDLGAEGEFHAAIFDRVRAGSWLDAPITLLGRGAGLAPEIQVRGGTVDLSQTEIGSGTGNSGQSGGGPIRATLDRLKISDSIELTGFRGEFSTAGGMDGSFAGKVNGGTGVTGRVIPRDGRSAFRILSEDAGGVLKSAGLLRNARGGAFDLTLLPAAGPGNFDGTLKIGNIRLRDAPAMAELLNAISVVGLLEQLAGNGILFTDVEAKFRLSPEQVTLLQSSAVGSSLGISMDGYYYFANGTMRFQGVVSPLYLLNAVGQILTRKGEGLIGFNYRLLGTPDNPTVRVNPLSLLTPGMFREIFRRPVPKVSR